MNVSSVKNLNGETFSAVQDAELTEVVQTNSASWGTSTIPTDLSANNITANSGFKIGNLSYGEYGLEGYGMDFDRALGSITILPNTAQGGGSNYGNINLTSKSGFLGSVATAECSINAFDWNKVNEASNTVVSNSATWGQGGAGDPEVESYVQTNSGVIDETVSTVSTNSGVWGGSALPVSAGPGIKVSLVDNTLLFSNDETVLYAGTQTSSVTLSEPITNFKSIKIYHNAYCDGFSGLPVPSEFRFFHMYGNSAQASFKCAMVQAFVTDSTHIKIDHTKTLGFGFTATGFTAAVTNNDQYAKNIITQVIGVNRINGGN